VLNIETITDLDTAKQIAILLQKENDRIHKRLEEQTRELARLKGQDGDRQLELEIQRLQSQMSKLQKMLFGASSEKRRGEDSSEGRDEVKKERQTGHGPKEQPELPRITEVHDVAEEERVCHLCGGLLEEWAGQEDETEEVSVVERVFFIKVHKQKKYRCKCGGCIKTAKKPPRLIEGGRYSTEFAVEVAVEKYLDHMPLERQVRKMKREGLLVSSQTLWDQIWALSKVLRPTYDALLPYIFTFPVICADETNWYLLNKGGRKKWYIWGASCPYGVYYRLDSSRGGKVAEELLGDQDRIGELLVACAEEVCGLRAGLSAGEQGSDRHDTRAVQGGIPSAGPVEASRGRAGGSVRAVVQASPRGIEADNRVDKRVGDEAIVAAGEHVASCDRIFARPLERSDEVFGGPAGSIGHESNRERISGSGSGKEEPLRLQIRARHRSGRHFLQPHRERQALWSESRGIHPRGGQVRARKSRFRASSARFSLKSRLQSGLPTTRPPTGRGVTIIHINEIPCFSVRITHNRYFTPIYMPTCIARRLY
jgi:transposase